MITHGKSSMITDKLIILIELINFLAFLNRIEMGPLGSSLNETCLDGRKTFVKLDPQPNQKYSIVVLEVIVTHFEPFSMHFGPHFKLVNVNTRK